MYTYLINTLFAISVQYPVTLKPSGAPMTASMDTSASLIKFTTTASQFSNSAFAPENYIYIQWCYRSSVSIIFPLS